MIVDNDDSSDHPVIVEKIENDSNDNPDQYLPRDQLKITLKIFLHDPDVEQLHQAVTAALSKLSTNRVDTLFVATPPELLPHIGIGSGAAGPEQDEARQQLIGETFLRIIKVLKMPQASYDLSRVKVALLFHF